MGVTYPPDLIEEWKEKAFRYDSLRPLISQLMFSMKEYSKAIDKHMKTLDQP